MFNKINESLHGRKFPASDDLERGVHDSVAVLPNTGILPLSKSYQRWQRCIDRGGEYV
jgi:hypothetical protein